jgi:hypothetical protein
MKRVLILLVLLNGLIFAYFQLASLASTGGHQALPELNPKKLKLLSDKELQALPSISEAGEVPPVSKE